MQIIRYLNIAEIQEARNVVSKLSDKALEEIYTEAVDFKVMYHLAYERLLNELNRRKDLQFNKEDSETLEKSFP